LPFRRIRELWTIRLGIAAADEVMASTPVATGELVSILPDWNIRPVPIYAMTATKVYPVRTRLFLDFVQAALKGFSIVD
jgi:LysR family transcriptional regulator for bpeEF and oprC